MKRKPIFVSVAKCAIKEIDDVEYEIEKIIVLCDDGSIWAKNYDESLYGKNSFEWERMKDIPQD
ncbi:hypothetical protein [Glaesserella parasuis]|uniref:hypothetical protein n=1 Tax=Glaesserella parasuis TaxID=738 RepID=UPI0007A0D9D1|nr:hypothetical protein [Glaesserella parasuis]AMW17507.1 hypothetical protein A4U84_10085 [Glaesserella parasuis]MDG6270912.1 hypothetical protein [Glaesserella parasuis]MDG6306706.1 hypothetical protein [Glaesserella parasuis]MDG6342753.1 hypothetical protein [Glaesserella parasuis]MDG6369459.1 hypothetical protein [Glaesserella parasuis]